MKLRLIVWIVGGTLLLSGCSYRSIPPEVVALRQDTKKKPVKLESSHPEKIIIDAGHGGKDFGALSRALGYEEKQLTLTTAHMLRNQLKQLGYHAILTRSQDVFISLDKRAELANRADADLFVSIHFNHSTSQEAKGIEIYTYKESPPSSRILRSKELAKEVLSKIIHTTGAKSRGLKEANFAVIRETDMPAILVEAGFLSNPQEREKIRDPKYLRFIASGIAKGIDDYLTDKRDH